MLSIYDLSNISDLNKEYERRIYRKGHIIGLSSLYIGHEDSLIYLYV